MHKDQVLGMPACVANIILPPDGVLLTIDSHVIEFLVRQRGSQERPSHHSSLPASRADCQSTARQAPAAPHHDSAVQLAGGRVDEFMHARPARAAGAAAPELHHARQPARRLQHGQLALRGAQVALGAHARHLGAEARRRALAHGLVQPARGRRACQRMRCMLRELGCGRVRVRLCQAAAPAAGWRRTGGALTGRA